MKKLTEKEILDKAMEIWPTVWNGNRKKLNKANLNKYMSACQKLVLLDLEDAGRHYDVAYYFIDNVFNTTELDLTTVKKFFKFFDGMKRIDWDDVHTTDTDFEIQRKNYNTLKEAGIKWNMIYLA